MDPGTRPAVGQGFSGDRVIEVPRAGGVDRERRQVRQVASRRVVRDRVEPAVARPSGRALDAPVESARQPALAHQRLDRSAHGLALLWRPYHARVWCPGQAPRAASPRSQISHFTFAASVLSATARPCPVSTPWDTGTSGVMPVPCLTPPPPRLRPLGVKYSPTVTSSAPPFESGSSSWKTP